jgi:uncharacterized protein YprB with RNaseH-like and TPR domain
MKIAFWDIETTNLKGDIGRVLIGSIYSFPEGKMYTYKTCAQRVYDDRKVCRQIRDKVAEHDMVVTWYGKGFDWPFLQTRLAQWGMKPMRRMFHLDLRWFMAGWRGLKPRNAKLSTAAEFFNLPERKDDLDVSVWAEAGAGKPGAINRLAERCESDVRLLYQIYWKLLPFVSKVERWGNE